MVVFTCNHCGDSIQKPKVEKHYQFSCRNPIFLTCVDCLKDFRGDEFDAHVKCVSEDQRYGAKRYNSGVIKKGEIKQESWVEMIRSIIKEEPNMKRPHRDLLNKIAGFDNVPRKKNKFMNFIKSSSGGRVNMNDIEAIWDIIENYKTQKSNNSNIGGNKNDAAVTIEKNAGSEINSEIKLKSNSGETVCPEVLQTTDDLQNGGRKEKRKYQEAENELQPTEKKVKGELIKKTKFDFKSNILDILQAANSLVSPTKLKKKVEKRYVKETGETFSDKALRKYLKKLKQMDDIVECTEQYVKLR